MFADCEGCPNLTETEDGYICERFCGTDIDRIHDCDEWKDEEE